MYFRFYNLRSRRKRSAVQPQAMGAKLSLGSRSQSRPPLDPSRRALRFVPVLS